MAKINETRTLKFTNVTGAQLNALLAALSVDADGNLIIDVPTTDPQVAGALWADTGVLTVSAGA